MRNSTSSTSRSNSEERNSYKKSYNKKYSSSSDSSDDVPVIKKKIIKKQNNVVKCSTCNVFTDKKNLMPEAVSEIYEYVEEMCEHCFWKLNYSVNERLSVDANLSDFDLGVAQYILKYYKDHKKCKENQCFICDYKEGKEILNIMNYDKLKIKKNIIKPTIDTTENIVLNLEEIVKFNEKQLICPDKLVI